MLIKITNFVLYRFLNTDQLTDDTLKTYQYLIYRFLIFLFTLILLSIYAFTTGIGVDYIFFLAFHVPLRKYSGGYHAKSPENCLISFGAYMTLIIYLSNTIHINFITFNILLTISGILVFIFAPCDSSNAPFTKEIKSQLKKQSRITFICLSSVLYLLLYFNVFQKILNIGVLSILGQSLTLTYKLINKTERSNQYNEKNSKTAKFTSC